MEIPVIDAQGTKVSSINEDESLRKESVNKQVVMDTVVAFRSAQRSGTASTKIRSEVAFSGVKPWKQKGTGRARVGDRGSPIWRKGGVVFGPRPHSYRKIVNRQVKQLALKAVLADRVGQNQVILVDQITLEKPKTQLLVGQLGKWGVGNSAMIILEKSDRNVQLAARNIPGISTQSAQDVNTYDILRHKQLVATPAGFTQLQARALADRTSRVSKKEKRKGEKNGAKREA
jgi:large subunit ribosomal protein L4